MFECFVTIQTERSVSCRTVLRREMDIDASRVRARLELLKEKCNDNNNNEYSSGQLSG